MNEIQDQSSNRDDSSEDLAFELVNRIEGKAYRFKCPSASDCNHWREKLTKQIENLMKNYGVENNDVLPANLMSFE